MPHYLAYTDADWERLERDWSAWWAGELSRPLVMLEVRQSSIDLSPADAFLTPYPLDMPIDDLLDIFDARLRATYGYGDAYPKWWPNFGAGAAAAYLGARVEHQTDTTWFYPVGAKPLAGIPIEYDAQNPWWQRIQAITQAAVARWGKQLTIAYTDLGGNLDILASLRGTQELLVDMADDPDEVERKSRAITDVWLRYFRELHALIAPAGRGSTAWAAPWAPTSTYMLQCDISCMIAPRLFERLVLPDLEACCAAIEYAFYHLDGPAAVRHLPALLSLERLRGIQWIPGAGQPSPGAWLPLLKRIRDGGKLVQVYVTPEEALKIARELGGQGFLFHITSQGERHFADGDIDTFLKTLYALG